MSEEKTYDLIILGGGLAGSLLFAASRQFFPNWNVLLCEQAPQLCGEHTWSFHGSDLPKDLKPLVASLVSQQWPEYEVQFPELKRTLSSSYASIRSQDLAKKIESLANAQFSILLNTTVLSASLTAVQTSKGHFQGRYVVDCRGWTELTGPLGYQKFIGLEIRYKKPHSVLRPILKDACLEQTDGYRFMYTLPMTSSQLLIEDTYYSNTPDLDEDRLTQEVLQYAKRFGEIDQVLHKERGCLPLVLSRQNHQQSQITLGARSQFYQPVTGYSLPQTLQMLTHLMGLFAENQVPEKILQAQKSYLSKKATQWTYFIWLNKMLFLAAEPHLRYRVLQRFYGLREDLIHRFYRGDLKVWDQLRILAGKPPVPLFKALKVLLTKNPALETTKA